MRTTVQLNLKLCGPDSIPTFSIDEAEIFFQKLGLDFKLVLNPLPVLEVRNDQEVLAQD